MIFDATADGRTMRVEVRGQDGRYTVVLDGQPLEVDARETGRHFLSILVGGRSYEAGIEKRPGGYTVVLTDDVVAVDLVEAARVAPARRVSGPARIAAPMPGKLVRVLVSPGQDVQAGQGLVVVEAMKMENEIKAPRAGRVKDVPAREGQAVDAGALLVVVE
ncbi:MAG: acetyl-CoA carboxylase biotin carboxyl carrier protein subunit [Acidobacteria bacterium]|jgi:biotin carboxyl carrier protein|nr:MAG: acetyl-CoA carboxylase biotin carboxyl carrier protein subunit [Acidobacteriota bacterium]